jgi:hypothetical protein
MPYDRRALPPAVGRPTAEGDLRPKGVPSAVGGTFGKGALCPTEGAP